MTTAMNEAYEAALETNTDEAREQMERHATAKQIMPGYHEEDIDYDAETFDNVTHAIITLVDALCEEGDITLEYDRRNLLDNFIRQAEYMAKRKEGALKSLAWKVAKAQRSCVGDEITNSELQTAINNWKDCKRQGANLRKHFVPAAIEAWDQVIGEPRDTGKRSQRDATTMDDLEANRIMQASGIGNVKA